jgi:holliday junction DNA helicase RuvA
VREDSQTLYGFGDADARNLFLTLLGVSGIGPSIALGALAIYDGPSLRQAIGDGDVTALTRIPKVGKKTAELLVLTLRDKVGTSTSAGVSATGGHGIRGPVVEALVGLGFALKQAEEATDKVLANDPDATTSSALRAALSMLGRK